ncbi:hypothetical protein H5410_061910 [Solanum commersonii]|uniref:Uncharacterized protein n=1 Tax=Solanum commersonii TaxID=4109 RepID=A0A9J5WAM8_SOLCO|nr:hypothetical protein H5410_061910 [Solanum commersonii]
MVRRSFLWQGNKEKRGYNLVKWDVLALNNQQGGLSLKKLRKQNTFLLQRWHWRFCSEEGTIRRRFIAGKHGLLTQWTTEEVVGTIGCSEIGEVANLLEVLNSHSALSVRHDKPRWKLHNKGVFTVKSCYSNLNTLQTELDRWPWKLVMPNTTTKLLSSWKGIGNRERKEFWWRTIPACIWWTLRKERNSRNK